MERFTPLVLAIVTVVLGATGADHILTKRAIPDLKPPKTRAMLQTLLPTPPPPPPEAPPARKPDFG